MMPKTLISGCLFTFLAFSCHLQGCVSECVPGVLASRRLLYEPEGGSVSLSCDVQHCDQKWTGGWGVRQDDFTLLTPSPRIQLYNQTITNTTTRLFLTILNLNQSDSGGYQCNIYWEESNSQGHVTQVNVTAGSLELLTVPEPTGRKLSSRLLVCSAASLCFPLALALACCFSSERHPAPPVPPPRSRNSSTARVKPKTEVVYAAMSLDRPKQQSTSQVKMATTPVIYSTLNFSTA